MPSLKLYLLPLLAALNLCAISINDQKSGQLYDIPDIVLFAIRNNECYNDKGYCNPYVIRINKQNDIAKANNNGISTNGPHILCYDANRCANTAEQLIRLGVKNIDLGPYQINYFWNGKYELAGYFELDSAEIRAKEIIGELINQYGYSWTTLGRYHNYDPDNLSRNRNYYRRMQAYIYSDQWNGIRPSDVKQMQAEQKIYPATKTAKIDSASKASFENVSQEIVDTYPQTKQNRYSLRQEAKMWYSADVEKIGGDSISQLDDNSTSMKFNPPRENSQSYASTAREGMNR